ncbi:MAG: helix-turn-helix transcriptional regulator [Ruminococcaceae bacterium]|nr:helix-turn-helix transcriptional regulator [Oscillospiraceae bacterium]
MQQFPDRRNFRIDILQSVHRIHVDPLYICPSRPANTVIYYLNGTQHFEFPGREFDTHAGDVLFLPYEANYINRVFDPTLEYFQVDFLVYQDDKPAPLFPEPWVIHAPDSTRFKDLIRQTHEDNTALGDTGKYRCFSTLCTIIDMLLTLKNRTDTTPLARIRPSVDYINENYQLSTSIREIAAMSSTCITNLERLFKECLNATPSAYRSIVRINHAKQLLLAGYSIEETAGMVGFYDSFHFSKTFKKLVGISPGEFAKAGQ